MQDIYLDKACLLQKLRPEFRAKYVINSCEHPHMQSISYIQQVRISIYLPASYFCMMSNVLFFLKQKFYSMATVVRNRTICNLVRQLIKLKPYIKVFVI